MSTNHSPFRRRMLALANGGHVRGPGSGTSDSIPARLSDGEFVLPTDTVRKVGVRRLQDLVDMTHTSSGKAPHPAKYADGGLVGLTPFKRREDYASNALQAMEQQRAESERAAQSAMAQQRQADADAAAAVLPAKPAASVASSDPAPHRLSSVAEIPMDGYRPAPKPDGSQDSWRNTEVGRNLTNAAAALPGVVGAVPMVAKTGGAISSGLDAASRLMNVVAATAGTAALPMSASAASVPPGQQPLPNGVIPSMGGAGRGSVNPPIADPSKSLPSLSPSSSPEPLPGYGPIGDRTTLTNEQAATMNPAGRISATRQSNGNMSFSGGDVSGQVSYNDASGKALPGGGINGKGFSGFDVAPAGANVALGPNGSYAFGSGGAQSPSPTAQRSPVGMTVEQAQREGLVGERVGYNPAYDKRLTSSGSGQGSAENNTAAENLSTSQGQSQGARERLLVAGVSAVPGVRSPVVRHSGNDWQARNDLRNAMVSAKSIMNDGGKWDKHGKGVVSPERAYAAQLAGADAQLRGAQPGVDVSSMRENAGIQRESLQQAGENQRADMRTTVDQQRVGLEGMELGLKRNAAGFQSRMAQRMENAQIDLENAKTTEEQRSARERLLALQGKETPTSYKSHVLPNIKNADGSTTMGGVYQENLRTGGGQWVQPQGQLGAAPMPTSKDLMVKGQVYQTPRGPALWDGGQFQLVR